MLADRVRMGLTEEDGGLILYDNGKEFIDWVGGYSAGGGNELLKTVNHLFLRSGYNVSSTAQTAFVTNIPINLTNVNKLYVEWKNVGALAINNYSSFIVSDVKMGNYNSQNIQLGHRDVFDLRIDEVDVSQLEGEYYIRVHAAARDSRRDTYSEVMVFKIWGEK